MSETSSAAPAAKPRQGRLLVVALALLGVAGALLYHNFDAETAELVGLGPAVRRQIAPPTPPNSFDLERLTIPRDQIRPGGPPKDGIPAITDPDMIPAEAAEYLKPTDRVAGVVVGSQARAYPLRIIVWHEIVNDSAADRDFAVTFCPLCDSVTAFDRSSADGPREFGVSGLLYNSNVLMYDRGEGPRSLWSQMNPANGISGSQAGVQLESLPVELTSWRDWLARYPDTLVMSTDTGFDRNYHGAAYAGYLDSPDLVFPVERRDERLPLKAKVLGVWVGDTARAYPIQAFADRGDQPLVDTIAGRQITLVYSPEDESLRVARADDETRWMYSLWFAWYAFRPETDVYGPGE